MIPLFVREAVLMQNSASLPRKLAIVYAYLPSAKAESGSSAKRLRFSLKKRQTRCNYFFSIILHAGVRKSLHLRQRKRHTERCAFFAHGDGEIARDGEAGAGLGRDRRRGRRKGVPRGRKQGVLEARFACAPKRLCFRVGEERQSLST